MSEYQFYEFRAIDRALSVKEMDELRSFSSRAKITPTSFVNDYAWGAFRGNEGLWMERYFDARLHLASWGTRVLEFSLPRTVLDLEDVREFCAGVPGLARAKSGKLVLRFQSEDEGRGEWIEGDGILSSLIPIRDELVRGDRRALFIAWLVAAEAGDLHDDDLEPAVPPGLGQLSAALDQLVDFLRLDRDLLAVAAQTSSPLFVSSPSRTELLTWLAAVPGPEKDAWLARMLGDDVLAVTSEMHRRMRNECCPDHGYSSQVLRRSVSTLLQAASEETRERERVAALETAAAKKKLARAAARDRARYLESMAGKKAQLWADVERLVATKLAKSYDLALQLLVDLRDLGARRGGDDFQERVSAFRAAHSRKPALLQRLARAKFGLDERSAEPSGELISDSEP